MDTLDVYIGRRLKNYTARFKSPLYGRDRLLQAVRNPERLITRLVNPPSRDRFEITKNVIQYIRTPDLSLIYTLQQGMFNLRLLL